MKHEVHKLGERGVVVIRYAQEHVIISKGEESVTLTFEEARNLVRWLEAT